MWLLYLSLTLILIFISGFHFYWAFGGKYAYTAVIPEKFQVDSIDRAKEIKTVIATLIVAFGMLFLALCIVLFYASPRVWVAVILRIFAVIFLVRAIGDFNMLGIFKKKSNSKFAYYDTRMFIPICVFLGIGFWLITYLG